MKKIEVSHLKAIGGLWYPAVLWSVLYFGHYYEKNLITVLCFWEIVIALLSLLALVSPPAKLLYIVNPKWYDSLLLALEILFILSLAYTGNVITSCFVLISLGCWRIVKSRVKDAYEEQEKTA